MTRQTVYTPDSPLRSPGVFLAAMLRDLAVARGLGWRLFVRDVSAQYRQSILGYLWVFVPPLVASLPFIYLRRNGIVGIGATPVPYAAYAMIGTIVWYSFVDAVNAPLKVTTGAKPMLARINLPREAIILSAGLQVLFQFTLRLALLAGVFVAFRLVPAPTAPLALFGMAGLMLFGFMIGLFLTPLGLLYTDIGQVIPVLTSFLMLVTAVLYPPPTSGMGAAINHWNPLTPLVAATREWLILGPSHFAPAVALIALASVVLLFVAWLFFRVAMPHLVVRIGS